MDLYPICGVRSTGIIDPKPIFIAGSTGLIDPKPVFIAGSTGIKDHYPSFCREIHSDHRSDLGIHGHVWSPLPSVLNISVRSRGSGVWLWRRQQVSIFYQPCSVRGLHAALLSHDVALWRHPAALRGHHRATPPLEPIMPPSAAKSLPPRTCCSPLETSCCPPKLSFRPQKQQHPAQYWCPSFPWSDRRLRDEPMMLERCAFWSRENVRRYNWHRRRPRRSTRERGSPKLGIRWRRRHKVWRWGRLCPLVVAFPAFCRFQGEVTRSVNLLALNCPLPSAVILSSRRRVDSSRIEAARRSRSTETGNGKHSFLRWNN